MKFEITANIHIRNITLTAEVEAENALEAETKFRELFADNWYGQQLMQAVEGTGEAEIDEVESITKAAQP